MRRMITNKQLEQIEENKEAIEELQNNIFKLYYHALKIEYDNGENSYEVYIKTLSTEDTEFTTFNELIPALPQLGLFKATMDNADERVTDIILQADIAGTGANRTLSLQTLNSDNDLQIVILVENLDTSGFVSDVVTPL